MKKTLTWTIAITTSFISLVAMLIFDFVLSLIYSLIGKAPLLSEIIDFIGEILDLGLTALFAYIIALFVWEKGQSVIEKINGETVEFNKSPISTVNNMFCFVFLGAAVFLGFKFAALIGDTVSYYTVEAQGFEAILMFLKAVKDTVVSVCVENIIVYKVCLNSLILFICNIFC